MQSQQNDTSQDFPLASRPWIQGYNPGVTRDVPLSDTSLSHLMEQAVRDAPDAVALDFFGATTTYRQLGDDIRRVAEGLRRAGVQAGDRVAIILPNCPQHVVAFYAAFRLGAVVVEHNPLYTSAELRHMFEDHGAKVAIVWDKALQNVLDLPGDVRPTTIISANLIEAMPTLMRTALKLPVKRLRESREKLEGSVHARGIISWKQLLKNEQIDPHHHRPTAHDIAILQYTSGTTGKPKGVILTHRNLESNARMGEAWIQPQGNNVIYGVLPLFHAYGLTLGLTISVLIQARLVLFPTVDINLILKALKKTTPTILPAVPPVYRKLLDQAKAENKTDLLNGINYGVSGAMNLPPELVEEWESYTGGFLVEGYGLTECSPIVSCNPLSKKRRAGSIGLPFPSTDLRIVDPDTLEDLPLGVAGELLVKGPQAFRGYWKLEEETRKSITADGWLRTGDIVTMDDAGFLYVVDRIKEVIITGGFNVSPTEVETALKQHDSVSDAAVVGLPAPGGGEEVVAAIILSEGYALDPEELKEHMRSRVTRYKVPRRFIAFDEDFPRTMLGKTQRRLVRQKLEDKK
ncbi:MULTISPECIES: long-chain-fatty-acid--CoA ligase [unclassified Rothia (in: high G+C Gram-positive bacteria)]|uniref:long-chain-fatty-acid--CoA ligase n=1 Tax=unclassified Rothia (in: high G+C Gram-positive bacteria) TaxID=2689056 RepID=UPI00195EF789|nr:MULTISPECIES: long-chain-fatty-acid--CoA ligase [unclassified Rothia (in: high G+C Gram-positive bacteria)]MBM7052074.1 AMP-binding protein [Rothia sp. ZJ1223]QRZ61875.1 AMP-binding protein [Rothia sp. ZJ932]